MFDDKRLDLLAAMYAHITGDTEKDAKRRIKRTPTGRAIARGAEVYLYFQPAHNMEEIARELPAEIREKFTYQSIGAAYLAVKDRETPEKDRAFADISPDRFASDDADDEPEADNNDEDEEEAEDETDDDD